MGLLQGFLLAFDIGLYWKVPARTLCVACLYGEESEVFHRCPSFEAAVLQ